MDFDKVLMDLHTELKNLDVAIESLERLQDGNSLKRKGRPPGDPLQGKRARKARVGGNGKKRE